MTEPVHLDRIPDALKDLNSWVLWRKEKDTKIPYQTCGKFAKAGDPTTWSSFEEVRKKYSQGGFSGIGFQFGKDPFAGVDLDDCRNPETEVIDDWARKIITSLDSYTEVSPSGRGVKIYVEGELPGPGRKHQLPMKGGRSPAIEMYDQGRYFAVTGWHLSGTPLEPSECQEELEKLYETYFSNKLECITTPADAFSNGLATRARGYVSRMEPAISGRCGHNRTFRVACVLILGFELDRDIALQILQEYNQRCKPPWSQKELEHKIDSAAEQSGPRGYLRDVLPSHWNTTVIPEYELPQKVQITTLRESAEQYVEKMKHGPEDLITLGLPEIDNSIGGGVERGEMLVFAARPSHGKSMVALQCVHHWTQQGRPVLFITEEMSPLALGKRTLQYASEIPVEHWHTETQDLEGDLHDYASERAECYISAGCGTVDRAVEHIESAVERHQIQCAVVDYAQLLSGEGHGRYEQVTYTSECLRRVASRTGIILLVLCQLNRQIEQRKSYVPLMSDIKETGQFEQDADLIVFVVWPHKFDKEKNPPDEFALFISKNRNREVKENVVYCKIQPSRQRLVGNSVPLFEEFTSWDDGEAWV